MAAPDVNSSFSKSAKAGLLALAMVAMPFAAANDAQAQQPTSYPLSEATRAARDYSANGGVGIVVYNGRGNSISPEEIGQSFVDELKNRKVKARYFIVNADGEGMAISYHIGKVTEGPKPVSAAASTIGDIVKLRQTGDKVLAQNSSIATIGR